MRYSMVLLRGTMMVWLLSLLAHPLSADTAAPVHSKLWGEAGELWGPGSRLPDISFAGYGFGETPLPEPAVTANVRDFGAVGDGKTDDSQAFLDALEATEEGAILIPAGTYVLSEVLHLRNTGVVLRGEGPDKTVLHWRRPLHEIAPRWSRTGGGRRTSMYAFGNGVIEARGGNRGEKLTDIVEQVDRGADAFEVASVEQLTVGQTVLLQLSDDDDRSFSDYIYAGSPGDRSDLSRQSGAMVVQITAIDGNKVTINRPLRYDIREAWRPELRSYEPSVKEVGVEHLRIDFPETPYGGHFEEQGWNAIQFRGVAHSWVRNVHIHNADNGIFLPRVRHCTVVGVTLTSDRTPNDGGNIGLNTGHHGVFIGGEDNLLTDFDLQTRFIHDITVAGSQGNVISNGRGDDLNLDHHRGGPYENVFTNLDVGKGTRVWRSGGWGPRGRNTAARATFWNLRSTEPIEPPRERFGPPQLNFVGLSGMTHELLGSDDERWIEPITPEQLYPQNIHEAQLQRRLSE